MVNLDEIFDRFHSPKKPIFKDRDVLRSTYVPESLPHRESEIRSLANILGPIVGGGTPSNAFLYGKPGGGKTVVTKYVINHLHSRAQEFEINFIYAFINCQMIDTAYRVYSALCDTLGIEDVPPTGLSTDKIFEIFCENLDKKKVILTIVLDEIDLLMKKDTKTLYSLTRMNTDLKNARVSLIGITNNINFKETVDPRIKSTLTEQEIVFPPYTAAQLKEILAERAKLGFEENVVETPAIERAAALAASEHGDARRALDLLRVAGEVAETEQDGKVIVDHVNKASQVIETDTVAEVLITLPIHSKGVLLGITILEMEKLINQKKKKKNVNDVVTTGDVYSEYSKICNNLHLEPLTQRRVGDLINELDTLGMIRTSVVSKGRYGRTRVIALAVQALEIHRAMQKDPRLEEMLPPIEEWML